MNKTIPLSVQVIQDMVNYLQTQPWSEVNGLLVAINKAAQEAQQETPAPNGKNRMEEVPA